MTRRRFLVVVGSILAALWGALPMARGVRAAETLPARLTDQEFWKLSSDLSEPNGSFRSDNLLSNELWLQYVIPDLTRVAKPDRVYIGVGPEQNFTYITALKPKMAFIVDIRRGNLNLHLMYKALFELSTDRAEFVSRLFAKPRPEGLGPKSTATELFAAYREIDSSEALYKQHLKAIEDHLLTKHAFALSLGDLRGIEYIYHAFYAYGPELRYSSRGGRFGRPFGRRGQPTYADLMVANDGQGQQRSYLASEETFLFLKELEARNMLVPVVGDFGGPKAIRAVGQYLKENGATVSAFYLSNVEQYLIQDDIWTNFCGNAATLPLDETSTFIRSGRGGQFGPQFGFGLNSDLGNMAAEVKACGPDGRQPPR